MFRSTDLARIFVAALVMATAWPAAAQTPGQAPSAMMQMVPILVIIVIMYFLMIRPQQRRLKQHQAFVAGLKRGDEVLTNGGILGRIEGLTDLYVTLEVAPNVRMKILRTQIASNVPTAAAGQEAKA
jgi:preprotein translocase subunit YajC